MALVWSSRDRGGVRGSPAHSPTSSIGPLDRACGVDRHVDWPASTRALSVELPGCSSVACHSGRALLSALLLILTSLEIVWANSWMIQTAPATVMQETALPCSMRKARHRRPCIAGPRVPGFPVNGRERRRRTARSRVCDGTWRRCTRNCICSVRCDHSIRITRSLHRLYRAVLAAGESGMPHPDALNLLGRVCTAAPDLRGQTGWRRCGSASTERVDNVAMWHNATRSPPPGSCMRANFGSHSPTNRPVRSARAGAEVLLWPSGVSRDLRHEAVIELPAGEELPEIRIPATRPVNTRARDTRNLQPFCPGCSPGSTGSVGLEPVL